MLKNVNYELLKQSLITGVFTPVITNFTCDSKQMLQVDEILKNCFQSCSHLPEEVKLQNNYFFPN